MPSIGLILWEILIIIEELKFKVKGSEMPSYLISDLTYLKAHVTFTISCYIGKKPKVFLKFFNHIVGNKTKIIF